MSFLFGQRPQPSSAEKIAAAEAEVEMVSDMFNRCSSPFLCSLVPHLSLHNQRQLIFFFYIHRLSDSCHRKCVPADYREGELNKGESVCLDRCASKFFDVNIKVSEKMQQQGAAGGAGGLGGM
jgi:mitochondrial import inner membrane translocase subunit TIM10